MKYKFFKINSFDFFSYLMFVKFYIEFSQNLIKINSYSMNMIQKFNLNIKNFELDILSLESLINCCGSAIFEKKQKDYFVAPAKLFPILIYLKLLLTDENNKLYEESCTAVDKNLFLFGHEDFKNQFINLNNKDKFLKAFIKNYKSFIHFINHYYGTKPKKKVYIKKGGLNV